MYRLHNIVLIFHILWAIIFHGNKEDKKVITDHLDKDSKKMKQMRSALEKRCYIKAIFLHLRAEQSRAKKVLEGQ